MPLLASVRSLARATQFALYLCFIFVPVFFFFAAIAIDISNSGLTEIMFSETFKERLCLLIKGRMCAREDSAD
ncbi:hypothetical protein CspHIS471_0506770 [Cutaneotrichosporon sp. HIS471]|nr:hypothetical protein CspHIS471_0506770 [Cutaneotrichosporon sp. HIS471]